MVIYGLNPVLEALRGGHVTALTVSRRRQGRLDELLRLAERGRVEVRRAEPDELNRLASGGVHQGVVATIRPPEPRAVRDLVEGGAPALIVVLDGIEDPHNLGAIARTAEAAGASGLVVPTRRAAPLTAAAVKASAGALAHLPVAPVVNVARALAELRSAGVWTVGLDAEAPRTIYEIDLRVPVALVVGGEGRGLRHLVREGCDWLAALPLAGRLDSLNASVAAGIALFEAVRQRRPPSHPDRNAQPRSTSSRVR
ncbi:MAG: 23S rRNA (guanosine(2251)-2'-O)-methyltransferase RlmB [Acidobacteria bacterium]|nr:23S rRNA (guanosine(2251)-2'-O)-methyltransferase RlmB [Acidobacteriota bacterium]MYJ06189.1 23S rRNA (guanosine(2251)-2'-O)-methyltransferase RlmB [Acidobacteriota bacterium]